MTKHRRLGKAVPSLLEGGFVPLSEVGLLSLEGSDRSTFLQSFCTQDLRGIQEGNGCEAFITSVQGKVLQHVFILFGTHTLRIVALGSDLEVVRKHLDRYIIREDVKIQSESNYYACAAIGGLILDDLGLTTPLCHRTLPLAAGVSQAQREEVQESQVCWVLRLPTAERLGLLLCPLELQDLRHCLAKSGFGDPLVELGNEAWETHRISAGFPINGIDLTADNLPQEVARDEQAISFTKGCYLGQETVARIDALGHVNRCRVLLVGQGEVPACTPEDKTLSYRVHESKPSENIPPKVVGEITSACYSPVRGCVVAMGYVRREFLKIGGHLQWSRGDLQVAHLDRSVREPLTDEEFSAIYDLRYRVLREPWGQARGSEQDSLDAEAYHMAIYDRQKKLLGTGRLHWNSSEEAQIRYMAVEEFARGEDVGRDLVWSLEAAARRSSASRIILLARKEIHGFYLKLGYGVTGPGPTLFDTVHHVRMHKDLKLVP